MAEEVEIEQEKTPDGMVKTETKLTKPNSNAWRDKQMAAMTEQRKKMLLMKIMKRNSK